MSGKQGPKASKRRFSSLTDFSKSVKESLPSWSWSCKRKGTLQQRITLLLFGCFFLFNTCLKNMDSIFSLICKLGVISFCSEGVCVTCLYIRQKGWDWETEKMGLNKRSWDARPGFKWKILTTTMEEENIYLDLIKVLTDSPRLTWYSRLSTVKQASY